MQQIRFKTTIDEKLKRLDETGERDKRHNTRRNTLIDISGLFPFKILFL